MNYIKRAFLNLTYKKKDNILLILVFAVIATLILSSLCIRAASAQSCRTIREQLGGTVTLRHKPGVYSAAGNEKSLITLKLSKRLASLSHVKAVNEIASAEGCAFGFRALGSMAKSGRQGKKNGDLYVMGVTNTELLDDFTNVTCKLKEGKALRKDDVGKPVALIEETLAQFNHLKVGDSLSISSLDSNKKITLTIVGIYENSSREPAGLEPVLNKANKIYVPYTQCLDLADSQGLDYSVFTMDDPSNIAAFEKEAKSVKLPTDCELDAKDGIYQRMAGPLCNLNFISTIMLGCVLFAGALILSLIVVLSLKGRKYEIGVLLSIGEKKTRIMAQMALEILIPVLIAFSLSAITGNIVAQHVGNVMLSNEVQSQKNITTQTTNEALIQKLNGQNKQPVSKINISMTWKDLLALYLAGIMLVLVSAAVPVVAVMRYHPSEILIKIE